LSEGDTTLPMTANF